MAADDNPTNPKQGKTTTTAGAVSPNATKKPKERVPVREELTQINQYLMCSLCSGYLIDATAIIECQHTFCKSCILKYLETNGYCPICDIELNTVKPHLSLRSDVIVQRLVYKLVPGLLVDELRRRKGHAESISNIQASEHVSNGMAEEVDTTSDQSTILSLDDVVSLSIEYFTGADDETSIDSKQYSSIQQRQEQGVTANAVQDVSDATKEGNDRRYLKCPAAVSVGLLKKFIRMKYGLSDDYRVDLLYNGDRDNSLENDLTLLDVAFIFKWNKDESMRLHYRIFERNLKSLVPRVGTKRPASVMDEPPDDDATSGPNNRPPMTSSSPSSKIALVSNNSSTGANNNRGNAGGTYRSTSNISTPVYDFSEGNSDTEQESTRKGQFKLRPFRKDSFKRSPPSNLRQSSSSSASRSMSHHEGKSDHLKIRRGSSGNRVRSSSVGTSGNEAQSEDADSDSSSSDSDEETKNTDLKVRSAAQTVMGSQVNGSVKLNLSPEKREPLKLSLSSVMAKSPEHKHKHKHHKMKHKKKKSLKISLSLNPSQKSSGKLKVSNEGKGTKLVLGGSGKSSGNGTIGGNNATTNFPVNVKPTTTQHLNSISKSISVSIGVGNNQSSGNGNAKQTQFSSGNSNSQTKKLLTSTAAAAVPKNKNIEMQPKTIPSTTTTTSATQSNHLSSNSNQSTSARSHPLLPDSVHVPKSVTLIPVNPVNPSSNAGSARTGGNVEKSTSNRVNSHTFTHPITNKSLHQITVTEVPPPPKSGSPSTPSNPSPTPQSNPIEKVIAATSSNKPQFHGPGSMEITKIFCPSSKDTAKKLKERKGLDISITVPPVKKGQQETFKQKVPPTTNPINVNKGKGGPGNSGGGSIFNAKMPPGITIGPAGGNKATNASTTHTSSSSSSSSGANAISSLGFSLPPHITAHPQQHPQKTVGSNSIKQQCDKQHSSNPTKPRAPPKSLKTKDNLQNKGAVAGSVSVVNKGGSGFDARKHLGDALASMIDMTNRTPSPPKQSKESKPSSSNKSGGGSGGGGLNGVSEKRAFDMLGGRKNSQDSPEPKRSKSSNLNDSSTASKQSETPLDLSAPSRSSSSNSSSPIHPKTTSPLLEKSKQKSPTPPKTSPHTGTTPTIPHSFPSPGKQVKGGPSPSILSSIAQSLAQKQLTQQQQVQQMNLHNQIMQLHQGLQNMQNMQNSSGGGGGGQGKSLSSLSPKGGGGGGGMSSLSPPMIPSPPASGFDPLRNLLSLSDSAAVSRHGKVHTMLGPVGLSHPHPLSLSSSSPSSGQAGSIFPHLVSSLGTKSSTGGGMLDPTAQAYLAAISAHNDRLAAAAAAGLTHFGGESFYARASSTANTNPPHGSLRIPSVSSKNSSSSSSNNNTTVGASSGAKKGSSTPPLSSFSSQHSPTKSNCSSSSTMPSLLSHSTKSMESKNTKINGTTFSSHLPILPPGIHNPLLPSYPRSSPSTLIPNSMSAASKPINSDKKGIPNSMKISNFLPSKKGTDTSNVEATITSGSNIGGGTSSLSKFLNSIPPLVQTNLSVSSASPKGYKSNNEEEVATKPQKKEVEKPISSDDPISCQTLLTNASTSPKLSEIKSESIGSLMNLKGTFGGGVGLVSPPSIGRNPQPQNQAVRQIPNPALLLRRQNNAQLSVSPTSEAKSLPFGQKSPLSEHALQGVVLPSLPFPGVSVPVQVKVDNDAALPIPIPQRVESGKEDEARMEKSIDSEQDKKSIVSTHTTFPSPNKEESGATATAERTSADVPNAPKTLINEVISTEEIVKIEYSNEDGDLDIETEIDDIDVGIETAPISDTDEQLNREIPEEECNKDSSSCLYKIKIENPVEANKVSTSTTSLCGEPTLESAEKVEKLQRPEEEVVVMEEKVETPAVPVQAAEEALEVDEKMEIDSGSPEVKVDQIETGKGEEELVAMEESTQSPISTEGVVPVQPKEEEMDTDEPVSMPQQDMNESEHNEKVQQQEQIVSVEIGENNNESGFTQQLYEDVEMTCEVLKEQKMEIEDSISDNVHHDNQEMSTDPPVMPPIMLPTTEEFEAKVVEEGIHDSALVVDVKSTEFDEECGIISINESEAATGDSILEDPSDNLGANQITINPEALQVEKEQEPASTKETLELKVNPLNNAEEKKLMESSSASPLELNCPSADTTANGIELSNPQPSHGNSYSDIQHECQDKKYENPVEQTEVEDKGTNNSTLLVLELPLVLENVEVEEKSQHNYEEPLQHPAEPDITATLLAPSSVDDAVEEHKTLAADFEKSENKVDPDVPSPAAEEIGKSADFLLENDGSLENEMISEDETNACSIIQPIISTATITTTANMNLSTSVLDVSSSIESPISSRNSLESPTSPDDGDIKKIETLEKVAAGLFATAANTINNNNNSLTINAPSCDSISITTTNASDLTTV